MRSAADSTALAAADWTPVPTAGTIPDSVTASELSQYRVQIATAYWTYASVESISLTFTR